MRSTATSHRRGGAWFARLAALLSACAFAPAFAQEAGPRPLRLADLTPRSSLVLGSDYGRMSDASGLSLPIAAGIQISEELVLQVEVPFGYATAPGEIAEPLVGNVGVGFMGSSVDRLGRDGHLRWGLQISGRVPTAPRIEDTARAERVARLRAVTPFTRERWSPSSAAIRVDVASAWGTEDIGVQLQLGGTAALPVGDLPVTLHVQYGATGGYRVHQALWLQAEVIGVQITPGATGGRGGHYMAAAVGARLALLRVSPMVYVSVPFLGDVEGERPLVIGVEVASW
jgi:hypothetical protein